MRRQKAGASQSLTIMMVPGGEKSFKVVFSTAPTTISGHFTRDRPTRRTAKWTVSVNGSPINNILTLAGVKAVDVEGGHFWIVKVESSEELLEIKGRVARQLSRAFGCSVIADDGTGFYIGGIQNLRPGSFRILLVNGAQAKLPYSDVGSLADLVISISAGQARVVWSALGAPGDVEAAIDTSCVLSARARRRRPSSVK